MKFIPWPNKIKNIVFFDFDETIRPIDESNREHTDIEQLERLMVYIAENHQTIFGWVSGSNFYSLLEKSKGYINLYPNFIGASLGSELVISNGKKFEASNAWSRHLEQSGFSLPIMDDFIRRATSRGFCLIKQNDAYQGSYKKSYYLYESDLSSKSLSIKDLIACNINNSLSISVTKCNPCAGDPEDAYDVDILPSCSGKGKQCDFISALFSVERSSTLAFGDSANDSEMLNYVEHPFVVENGDISSIKSKFTLTEGRYCEGIIHTLRKFYNIEEVSQ